MTLLFCSVLLFKFCTKKLLPVCRRGWCSCPPGLPAQQSAPVLLAHLLLLLSAGRPSSAWPAAATGRVDPQPCECLHQFVRFLFVKFSIVRFTCEIDEFYFLNSLFRGAAVDSKLLYIWLYLYFQSNFSYSRVIVHSATKYLSRFFNASASAHLNKNVNAVYV